MVWGRNVCKSFVHVGDEERYLKHMCREMTQISQQICTVLSESSRWASNIQGMNYDQFEPMCKMTRLEPFTSSFAFSLRHDMKKSEMSHFTLFFFFFFLFFKVAWL